MLDSPAFATGLFKRSVAISGTAADRYDIGVPADRRRALAFGWLALGLAALAASGVLSLLLVVSRTPGLNALAPVADFFRVTLVAHVDLSVLVWFLAFGSMLWTFVAEPRALIVGWAGLALAALGAAILALAPFVRPGHAIMSNYVPVIDSAVFIAGLSTFAAGVTLACGRAMSMYIPAGARATGPDALRLGLNGSMVAAGMAAFAFAASFAQVDRALDASVYYELVFWGAGHVLQLAYTLLILVAWLWLASAAGLRVPLPPRAAAIFFAIALATVYVTPFIYLLHPVASVEHPRLQTWLMRFGGSLAVPPVALAVGWALARSPAPRGPAKALHACLAASLVLFCAGGLVGFTIAGSNVRVPAHYHGCIVGVTLAMMGLTYLLLPRFGYAAPASRLATWQPWIYGGGQLLHVAGLVISGGYGVQRKTAGAEQVLRTPVEVMGMGIMGVGGLIAICGGLAFLWVVARSLRGRE